MSVSRERRLSLDIAADRWETSVQHHGQILAALENDYQRYLYCHKRWEESLNSWFEGQRAHVVATLRSSDARLDKMGVPERVTLGKQRWIRDLEQPDISEAERKWDRWQQAYLSAWSSRQRTK
jgi:hypothetical protein